MAVHDIDASEAEAVAAKARQAGVRAVAIGEAFGRPGAADRVADLAEAALGTIDILVSTVAVQRRAPFADHDPTDFARTVAINLGVPMELIRRLSPGMAASGWGRILTIGSVQQVRPHPEMATYAATKAAQLNLVRNLARQLAPAGVTVNNLAPGVVLTGRNADVLADPVHRARVTGSIPMGRIADPSEMAGAALLLCSAAGGYITGANLAVDGGLALA